MNSSGKTMNRALPSAHLAMSFTAFSVQAALSNSTGAAGPRLAFGAWENAAFYRFVPR